MHNDYDRRTSADYKSDGQKFYELLNEEFNDVTYDPKTGKGRARAGSLGVIEFQESGNDSAVIVKIIPPSFKADAENAWKTIGKLRKIFQAL